MRVSSAAEADCVGLANEVRLPAAMSAVGLQLALVGAALIGPGAWKTADGPDCGIGRAPSDVQRVVVASGDRLHSLLRGAGVKPNEIERLRRAFGRRPNLHALSIGDRIDVAAGEDGRVLWFRYRHDSAHAVCAQRTLRDDFVVDHAEILPEVRLARVHVTVERDLRTAMKAAGENAQLAAMVRELFVDRAIVPSEDGPPPEVTVVVERRAIEGELLDYGRIFAAELRRGEDVERAFHYVRRDGESGYYTAAGEPRVGTRLRSPVPGVQTTSEFGMRRHPIKRRRRMHKGLDYGATHGTPVLAAADGVVVFRTYKRGLGRFVALRHDGDLQTRYAHLSSFAMNLRSGVRVRQGQTIGYVGNTGLSSGAHLHFETLVGGRHVNPRRLLNAPAPALPEAELEGFAEHVEELQGLLHPDDGADNGA